MDDHRDISARLDGLTPHQLIDEICQIRKQYLPEVGAGSRVSWPESIRSRVLALARLGVARKKVAELNEIPAATIFPRWAPQKRPLVGTPKPASARSEDERELLAGHHLGKGLSTGSLGGLLEPVTAALEFEHVPAVQESVEDGAGDRLIPHDFAPVFQNPVRDDERAALLVTVHDDFQEFFASGGR
jgi:hypothetical protein